jgi:hypothetical protein
MSHLVIHYPETADGKPYQVAVDDQRHFLATVNRALCFTQGSSDAGVRCVEIYVRDRTQPKSNSAGHVYDDGGWLEHAIVVNYEGPGNRRLCIGAIERRPGEQSEFHS